MSTASGLPMKRQPAGSQQAAGYPLIPGVDEATHSDGGADIPGHVDDQLDDIGPALGGFGEFLGGERRR